MILILNQFTWFLGTIGNSVSGVIILIIAFFLFFFQRKRVKNQKTPKFRLFLSLSLISLSLYFFSAVCIYLMIYALKQESYVNNIIFANGIWLFLDFFLICYIFAIFYYLNYRNKKLIRFIIFISTCYILLSIPLFNNRVYWNNGAVVVEFIREEIVLIHSYFSILYCFIGIFLGFYRFMHDRVIFTKNEDLYKDNNVGINKSIWIILSLFILLITFTLPRANQESFINPINVKIFGFLIYGFYLVFSFLAFFKPKLIKLKFLRLYLKIEEKDDYEQYQYLLLGELIIFVLIYVILQITFFIIQPYIIHFPDSDSALIARIAFFLFELGGTKWFMHIIGALIPSLIAITMLITFLIIQKKRKNMIIFVFIIFILQSVTSAIFNIPLKEILWNETSFKPITIGFYFSPLFVLALIFFLSAKNNSCKINDYWNSGKRKIPLIWKHYCSPILIYIPTVFSTILTDFFHFNSPTGKFLIGGDSFVDGIFTLPILVALISTIFFYVMIYLYPKSMFLSES